MYYMLYTALCPDKNWRLVLYLYYTKYTKEGDNIYFYYINLNILALLAKECSSAIIQGSLLLDNKDKDNCTIILASIYCKLGE